MTELNLTGTTLGRFEILRELGRGGMAVVYQARQTDLDRIVALKVLPPSLSHDASYIARFRQEARSAAHLEHPHIMPIYDVGEAGGLHYIAMKYIAGRTVKDLIRAEGALTVPGAATILAQVGDALDYAHRQGVIHRDIKPSNMMVTGEGWVFLTDFGLARGTGTSTAGLTVVGTVMGTPEYMSPEQAQGLATVGPATDIYALGVVLYELLTGTFPFKADTPMGMLAARLLQAPTPPRDIRGDLPPAVEDVVMRALARKPEARFASAGTMVAALRAAAGIGSAEPPRPTTPSAGLPAIGDTIKVDLPRGAVGQSGAPARPPYVRTAPSPDATVPLSASPPLPGPALNPPAGAQAPLASAPRKGPSSLTIILGVVGACLVACAGLIALVALWPGPPGPDTPVTPVLASDVSALLARGDAALTNESLAAAMASYEQAIALAPDEPQIIERLALASNAGGDWADAETYANQLIDATASSTSQVALGYALLADALASQGDMTAALGEIDKAVENDPEQALGHAILSNLRASRAEAIGSTAEMDIALASLDRAVDTIGDETTLVEALTRNALGYTFGQEFQLSGDQEYYRQSEEQYQAAIDLLPTAGLLRSNLAYIKAAKERYDEARGDFEHAVEAGYAPAQAGIGWTYYREGETAQAEVAFDKAIALAPDGPYGYYGKGRLRYDEQDYDGAIELLTQAVERSPRSPEIQSWLGEAALWKAFTSEDRAVKDASLSQAADAYRAALASNDRYTYAASGLGWALQYQEQYEESAAMFEQAIALDPNNAAHYNGKGWSLFNLGRSAEAEAEFRAALERDGSYVEAHYHLGRALEEQGRNDEARAAYQRALEINPEYQEAQERLDGLP